MHAFDLGSVLRRTAAQYTILMMAKFEAQGREGREDGLYFLFCEGIFAEGERGQCVVGVEVTCGHLQHLELFQVHAGGLRRSYFFKSVLRQLGVNQKVLIAAIIEQIERNTEVVPEEWEWVLDANSWR